MSDTKDLTILGDMNNHSSLTKIYDIRNLANTPSFGGNTLAENAQKAVSAINKMADIERVWNRPKTEWIWKHGNLCYYSDYGNMRQLSAEIADRRQSLDDAKWKCLKNQAKVDIKREALETEKSPAKRKLLEIEIAELEEGFSTGMKYIEGAFKDVLTLENLYDQIMKRLGSFSELDVEAHEAKHHIMLSVSQALRDVRETGKIFKGNAEYMEWIGLNVSKIEQDLIKAVEYEKTCDSYDGTYIKDFVTKMADELYEISNKRAEVMGFSRDDQFDKAIPYSKEIKKDINNV